MFLFFSMELKYQVVLILSLLFWLLVFVVLSPLIVASFVYGAVASFFLYFKRGFPYYSVATLLNFPLVAWESAPIGGFFWTIFFRVPFWIGVAGWVFFFGVYCTWGPINMRRIRIFVYAPWVAIKWLAKAVIYYARSFVGGCIEASGLGFAGVDEGLWYAAACIQGYTTRPAANLMCEEASRFDHQYLKDPLKKGLFFRYLRMLNVYLFLSALDVFIAYLHFIVIGGSSQAGCILLILLMYNNLFSNYLHTVADPLGVGEDADFSSNEVAALRTVYLTYYALSWLLCFQLVWCALLLL